MGLIPTFRIGQTPLSSEELSFDKRRALRVGPCAIGDKALYVNSFYIKRMYYVVYADIARVFKRVAMSKGGYTGKGVFGAMAYFVVQMKDGTEKKCNFKHEDEVDLLLSQMQKDHPEIPVHSAEAERKLREAEEKELASYLRELTPEAKSAVTKLENAKSMLKIRAGLSENLSASARRKRSSDMTNPFYVYVAVMILVAAIAAAVIGLFLYFFMDVRGAIFAVLGGFTFTFLVVSARVLPTGRNNKAAVQKEWENALSDMRIYLEGEKDFPVPPQYAHPIVLDRMIRAIKKGKAVTVEEAFSYVKEELKGLDKSVQVSQKEYDEVVAVKPMFLICDYQ